MAVRKLSTIVALLWAACAFLLVAPLGSTATTSYLPDGTPIDHFHKTSIWESDHDAGVRVVEVVLASSVVALGLIRFGGIVGGLVVALFCGLGLFASMLTVGIFLAPGGGCLILASALSISDRIERRARRRRERHVVVPPRPLAPT